MKKPTKSEQGDMNTFTEENNCKTVEKQTVIVEEAKISASTSGDLIVDRIDEAVIQAEDVMAISKSVENTTVNPGDMKPSNLEIQATLSNALIRDGDGLTINPINYNASLTACQLAAYLAEEAPEIVVECQDLMGTISLSMQVLQSNIGALYVKASEASERGTDYDNRANFYRVMASKCESSAKELEYRAIKLETALNNLKVCKTECSRYAVMAEEIAHESLDESIGLKSSAGLWTNKGRTAIIVALKEERAALFMMKRIWSSLQDDMEYEERANNSADDSDNAARCQNTDRRTKIGHMVVTFIGFCLPSAIKLFKAGSDSFNAILALSLLTIGYCAVYWLYKLYMYLRSVDDERTAIQTEPEDEFLEHCDRKLETVENHFQKYRALMDLGTESDTGGLFEMHSVDDI